MCHENYAYIKEHGLWFEPAVSKEMFGLSVENKDKKRMFLYGRPSVARNLFYTAIDAINEAFNSGELNPNEWEIFMAGQDKLPNIRLSTGATIQNLGKLTMTEYNQFIRTIDVAISPMMAPHPNYPTLEFASVGAAVVTTRYVTKQDLSNYSPNIFIADLDMQDLSKNISKAANMSYAKRMQNQKATNIPAKWDTTLQKTLQKVTKLLTQ
jgi:hypothetical protein